MVSRSSRAQNVTKSVMSTFREEMKHGVVDSKGQIDGVYDSEKGKIVAQVTQDNYFSDVTVVSSQGVELRRIAVGYGQPTDSSLSNMNDAAEKYALMGISYRDQGDYQSAIRYLNKAAEINANLSGVYQAIATVYLALEDYDQQIVYAKKELDLNPNLDVAHSLLAVAYAKKRKLSQQAGDYLSAEKYNQEIIKEWEQLRRLNSIYAKEIEEKFLSGEK